MTMTPTCVTCIFSQSLRVCETLGVDEETTKKVLDEVACMVPQWRFDETPPQVAARVYPKIAQILHTDDIYRDFKKEATERAETFLPFVEAEIGKSGDRFLAALKAAVAGNVIDLAATASFDLEEEVEKVFETPFAIDDSDALRRALERAERLLVVGDNAGEHLFDKVMMREFKGLFPDLRIYYAVRGKPIINDVTVAEAKAAGIDEVAEIVDSGVDTPGLDLTRINKTMKHIYEKADIILVKGMGNYEGLSEEEGPIFFLLKAKCGPVARELGVKQGQLVLAQASKG